MSERPDQPDPTWGNCAAVGCFAAVMAGTLLIGFACLKFMRLFSDMEWKLGS